MKKYNLFKKDGENKENSEPTRIEALFEASFHLIEACAALHRIHINKHQMLRQELEKNKDIFSEKTEAVWSKFQELENQIRPGQIYGGKINGEQLKRAEEIFNKIEEVCNSVLRKANKA